MRCPKCGFHSFDYLDSCRKCGSALTELRRRCNFQGYVAPTAATASAPELPDIAEAESDAIDFGFDGFEESDALELPALELDDDVADDNFPVVDPSAIELAADIGLSLDLGFGEETENLPDANLPKVDNRF